MIQYFFKTAIRNLLRSKNNTLLNISGLVGGLVAFFYIMIHVYNEFNFDNFHLNSDRIYRCVTDLRFNTADSKMADSNDPLAAAIMNELPEAESVVRLCLLDDQVVSNNTFSFIEDQVLYADSNFLSFFDFALKVGNRNSSLNKTNSAVLTTKAAKKYFGSESPIGRTLVVGNDKRSYEVTAVIENVPKNSHLQFDILLTYVSIQESRFPMWGNWQGTYTYVTVKEGTNLADFSKKYSDFQMKYYNQSMQEGLGISLEQFEASGSYLKPKLQPLSEIHLDSSYDNDLANTGNKQLLLILELVGVLILIIACINFTNISTAKASKRAREIGIKKVSGGLRGRLITQLLSESILQCIVAVLFGIILFIALLPVLNNYTSINIEYHDILNPVVIAMLIALPLILGVFAGGYPAFYLTQFNPAQVLKGGKLASNSRNWMRGGLVSFQFLIFVVLIICTLFINKQIKYVQTKDTGFKKENVVLIENTDQLGDDRMYFKEQIAKSSIIKAVSYNGFFEDGGNAFGNINTTESFLMERLETDKNFLETFNIEMVEGRYFEQDRLAEKDNVVISESAAKILGWDSCEGKYIKDYNRSGNYKVIGIIKDFQRWSFRIVQEPLVIYPRDQAGDLTLSVTKQNQAEAIKQVEEQWNALNPSTPFSYSFLDDRLNTYYESDVQLTKVLTAACILAIIIACFGLIGLVTFSANARQKEIGVRKVNGAKVTEIMTLLNEDYLKWVIVAFVLGCPAGYYAIKIWLENFSHKTPLSWWVFLVAGLLALGLALVTVSWQTFKAARQNPVEALRYE